MIYPGGIDDRRVACYDVETFPNFFCMVAKLLNMPPAVYEISERRNDAAGIAELVGMLERMVGFNNEGFDYPVVHFILQAVASGEAFQLDGAEFVARIYQLAMSIIHTPFGQRSAYTVWGRHRRCVQVDLMKVHHLDNRARMTSLKALEVYMRSPSVEEMPHPPGTWLTRAQMDDTIRYCANDVLETERALTQISLEQVAFREELGTGWLCLSDASVGKRVLREALEQRLPGCTKMETNRSRIRLGELVLPYIQFKEDGFREVLEKFKLAEPVEAGKLKGEFPKIRAYFRGLTYHFGLGGMHASRSKDVFTEDEEYEILDIDGTSYYPSLAIVNRLHPEHLGEVFCDEYYAIFEKRQQYPKGSARNLMYKLSLNAIFGDSGSQTSKGFKDPAFMLSITINGQLLMCIFVEGVCQVPGVEVLQANTDGITIRFPRSRRSEIEEVMEWWQTGTGIRLETVSYDTMWIRDVNNYVARSTRGKVKLKGAYEYELPPWKDPSMLAVARAAEAHMVHGRDVREFLTERLAADPWDFLIRARVRRPDLLLWGGMETQRIGRYYVARPGTGMPLTKLTPAKVAGARGRITSYHDGRGAVMCNRYGGEELANIDLDWYAGEVEKIIIRRGAGRRRRPTGARSTA